MAFGSDITETLGSVGGRTSAQGFNLPDEVRKQYTGYEHDDESGLDYAQARYYNSSHGRFTSVDPLTASANVKDPQTFNRYSYALNSPYKFTDPLGLISEYAGSACGNRCHNSDGGGGGYSSEYSSGRQTEGAGPIDESQQGSSPQGEPVAPLPSNIRAEVTARTQVIEGATLYGDTPKPETANVELHLNSSSRNQLEADGRWAYNQGLQEQARFSEAMKQLDTLEKDVGTVLGNPNFKISRNGMEAGNSINFISQEVSISVGVNLGEVISSSAGLTRTYQYFSERVSEYNKIVADTNVGLKIRAVAFADNPANSAMKVRILYSHPRVVWYKAGESHVGNVLQPTHVMRMDIARKAGYSRLNQ